MLNIEFRTCQLQAGDEVEWEVGTGHWLTFNLLSVLVFKKGGREFQKANRFNKSS